MHLSRFLVFGGLAAAAAFFGWLVLGLIPGVPSMVEVFGVPGLRYPAAVGVSGLLVAAIGLRDF